MYLSNRNVELGKGSDELLSICCFELEGRMKTTMAEMKGQRWMETFLITKNGWVESNAIAPGVE